MARQPSSIDKLPPEVRDVIAGLRRQGRTIDEILDHLKSLGEEVSRSALGRHVKSLAEIGDQMRRVETLSKFVVEKFGEETDDRVARASMHILQGIILDLTVAQEEDEDGNPIPPSPETVKSLALAVQRLTAAQRMDAERELKLRELWAKEAAAKVGQLGKQMGWTAEMAQRVRSEIMGVRAQPK